MKPSITIQDIRKSFDKPPSEVWPEVSEKDLQLPMRDGFLNRGRVYSPSSGATGGPLLVMSHGGGYCLGKLEMEEVNCRK
jgi:acetyl esterase/lipase